MIARRRSPLLTVNALVASTGVLIPMQCEFYALEGLSALLETLEGVREHSNPSLEILGLLRTMYDPRNGLTRDVSRQLLAHFGDRVFRTVIPRNICLAEAPSHGLPAVTYDRLSRGLSPTRPWLRSFAADNLAQLRRPPTHEQKETWKRPRILARCGAGTG